MSGQKAALLVVGAHRSGTSATARVLNLLGCDLPRRLIEANPTNPAGHWESREVVALNGEILASSGAAWDDWSAFDRAWYASPVAQGFRARARAVLEGAFADSRLFVLKDPRLCRLLPFWLEAVRAFGAAPFVVSPIRNPLDVALSLEERDGIDPSIGHLIWLRYVLDAEKASREVERAYLRYETLLSRPHAAANALGTALGISWPKHVSIEGRMEIDEFLSSDLHHHRADDDALLTSPALSRWIVSSFEIFDRWCRGEARADDTGKLGRIRAAFDAATPAFARAVAAGRRAVRKREGEIAGLERGVAERDGRIVELSAALSAREGEIAGLERGVAERDGRIVELSAALSAREGEIAGLERGVAERDGRIVELSAALSAREGEIAGLERTVEEHARALALLYASRSWRVTAPLRSLRRTPGMLAWRVRGVVTRTARAAWRRAPLTPAARVRLKNGLFGWAPWLFGRTGAYRNWEAARRGAVVGETGRECASWGIMATPHTLFVAEAIARRLQHHGWNVDTMTHPPNEFSHDFYVVICPQIFEKLPPYEKCVSFQMEQSVTPRWFDKKYLDILHRSFAVLEYATHNLPFLKDKGVAYPHVHYLPIGGLCPYGDADSSLAKTCDVLFYGDDLGSPRRQRLLSALREKFDVRVENDMFGPPMERVIRSARVVVNLHHYEDALLETPRIWQCLSLGTPVVSETTKDQDDYPALAGVVRFFERGSVDSMLHAVEDALENPPSKQAISAAVETSSETFSFMFDRFLLATDFLPIAHVEEMVPLIPGSGDKIVVSMPETFERRLAVRAERMLDDWTLFDGIRRQPGWVGCGLSLHVIVRHAIRHDMKRLVVAEDDVLLPEDFPERFGTVNRFLDRKGGSWNILTGLISDLHRDVKILEVEEFEEMTFVTIDKMTSTVFCIFNESSLDLLMAWDYKKLDVQTNTVDRFIENSHDLRIVVPLPFLVKHSEKFDSVLWGFKNTAYSDMIAESENRLRDLALTFKRDDTSH